MNKEDLRIVFLGTPEFAVESLDALYSNGFNIVGVVTMPDKPAGRGHKMLHSAVKQYALEKNLHLMQPVKLKDPEFVEELRSLNADLFIVIAFRMLPEVVWQMPRLGTFNLHASLLPRYRGAAPINWAVINGDTETGVTTFFLKHEIDTGDILCQEHVDILPDDCVGDVHDKLMHLGAQVTLDTVNHILAGDLTPVPQDQLLQGEEATPAPKIFKETCLIDWSKPAKDVRNLVRGLSPYPAAWTMMKIGDSEPVSVKIFKVTEVNGKSLNPGETAVENDRIIVGCGTGAIAIEQLQVAGKKAMPTADFLRGTTSKNITINGIS
ncbi:MAG: methionyl-tRNA formyltransferase [Muribaculaceae bacterium]|nr:methionyl-tRNA formyltransferase [Muribaculaceae bacterium]